MLFRSRNKIHNCLKSCNFINEICFHKIDNEITLKPDKTTFTFSVLQVVVKNISDNAVGLSFHDYSQIIDSTGGVYKPFIICDELIPRGWISGGCFALYDGASVKAFLVLPEFEDETDITRFIVEQGILDAGAGSGFVRDCETFDFMLKAEK